MPNLAPPPPPRRSFRAYLASRARLVAGAAVVAAIAGFARPAPAPRTIEGVASLLGRSVGGTVDTGDFLWEPRGGVMRDALAGRRVLFLARRGSARELFRARVRLTRAGRAISVAGVHDLSRTPDGDERDLVGRGSLVAFAMTGREGVLGVRVLDLSGERDARDAATRWQRLQASFESLLDTGAAKGLRVVDVTFDRPPAKARFELQGSTLVLALGDEAEPASVDVASAAVNGGPRDPYGVHAHVLDNRVQPFARTVRAALAAAFGDDRELALEPLLLRASRFVHRPASLDAPSAPALEEGPEGFPPAALPGGDGAYHAVSLPRLGGARPPAMAEARADRDGAAIRLVAIDTRQLDLVLVPGEGAPRAVAGPSGTGLPPKGAVAAFAGVSPAPFDPGAMVVAGRALAPARAGLPTLLVEPNRGPRIGLWSDADAPAEGPWSLRQASPALLPDPHANAPLAALAARPAERSALCVTSAGQLEYAYAPEATAEALAAALATAKCARSIPLATSPGPVGLAIAGADGAFAPLDRAMSFPASPLARGSYDDVVYLVPRSDEPAPKPEDATWAKDAGTQPPPAWSTAVHEATVIRLGAQVHLLALAPGRFSFRIRAGEDETVPRGAKSLPKTLDDADEARALVALGLGNARRKHARGLTVGGVVGLPMHGGDGLARLVADANGALSIVPADDRPPDPGADASELPLTADDGKLRPDARALGSMRARAALGILKDGTVLVATSTFDSDEATTDVLLEAGCARVVSLDRGAHDAVFVERAGSPAAIAKTHETTALYAIGVPETGRARPL